MVTCFKANCKCRLLPEHKHILKEKKCVLGMREEAASKNVDWEADVQVNAPKRATFSSSRSIRDQFLPPGSLLGLLRSPDNIIPASGSYRAGAWAGEGDPGGMLSSLGRAVPEGSAWNSAVLLHGGGPETWTAALRVPQLCSSHLPPHRSRVFSQRPVVIR